MLRPTSAATSRVRRPSKPRSAIWLKAARTSACRRSSLVSAAWRALATGLPERAGFVSAAVEFGRNTPDRSVEHVDHPVELVLGDDKGRAECDHVSREGAEDHAVRERRELDPAADPLSGLERRPREPVPDELYTCHQTEPTYVSDQFV